MLYVQVLKMYDVDFKRLNGIKSMDVNSLACIGVKGDESEFQKVV